MDTISESNFREMDSIGASTSFIFSTEYNDLRVAII